jgi:hypothetical protein
MLTTHATKDKLREAEYFLRKLLTSEKPPLENPDVFRFHLSAFLSAWASVWDYMLYDFALYFFPSLTRDDDIRYDNFKIAAKASDHEEAIRFADWRNAKFRIVNKSPLWKKRIIVVHRRYPDIKYEIFTSRTSSVTYLMTGPLTETPWTVDLEDLLNECKEGFQLMRKVIKEAEDEFG